MSDKRRPRAESKTEENNDLQYKHYKPWETQARFLRAGQNKSRALDNLVQRERDSIKRHNRLVDLKLEEQAKQRKRRHFDRDNSEAPTVPVPFGKESIQDEEYSQLVDETHATRKQQRQEHKQQKREHEEAKAKSSKKRKREEVLDSPEEVAKKESSDTSDEPPTKLKKDASENNAKPSGPTSTEATQSAAPQEKAGKPARSFAEARARWEDKQREKKEKQEAYEKRQQQIAEKQEEQRKTAKKMMKRTPRGQPIMKNVIGHMLSKLEKQGLRK